MIEPYEKEPVVRKVTALSADELRVELENGAVQEIEIFGFEGPAPRVDLTEYRDGRWSYWESTISE